MIFFKFMYSNITNNISMHRVSTQKINSRKSKPREEIIPGILITNNKRKKLSTKPPEKRQRQHEFLKPPVKEIVVPTKHIRKHVPEYIVPLEYMEEITQTLISIQKRAKEKAEDTERAERASHAAHFERALKSGNSMQYYDDSAERAARAARAAREKCDIEKFIWKHLEKVLPHPTNTGIYNGVIDNIYSNMEGMITRSSIRQILDQYIKSKTSIVLHKEQTELFEKAKEFVKNL